MLCVREKEDILIAECLYRMKGVFTTMNEKGRTIFYGVAGAYLVYLAYDMFQTKAAATDVKLLLFSVVFGVAGVVLLIMAGKSYKQFISNAIADEPQEQIPDTDVLDDEQFKDMK